MNTVFAVIKTGCKEGQSMKVHSSHPKAAQTMLLLNFNGTKLDFRTNIYDQRKIFFQLRV